VSEQHDGEPRIGLLSTIRRFTVDLLRSSGEVRTVHYRHAQFYLALAESRGPPVPATGPTTEHLCAVGDGAGQLPRSSSLDTLLGQRPACRCAGRHGVSLGHLTLLVLDRLRVPSRGTAMARTRHRRRRRATALSEGRKGAGVATSVHELVH
jgi:hypothetical protein